MGHKGTSGGNSNVHKFQVVFDEKLDRKCIPKTLKDDLDQVDTCKRSYKHLSIIILPGIEI